MSTAETFGFTAQALGLLIAVLMLAARGFRRFWTSVFVLTTVTMAAIVAEAPIVLVVAVGAELALILGTTARLMWSRDPWGPPR